MKTLTKYFLRGLVVVVPVGATLYALYAVFVAVDSLIDLSPFLGRDLPGLGFAATLLLILLVGILASHFTTRWLFRLIEALFQHVPVVKLLYNTVRDLINALIGDKKSFDTPVLVDLSPAISGSAIGFITRRDLGLIGVEDRVAVYFPQSYNIAGNLVILPAERVEPLDADPAEILSFVVSGGVTGGSRAEKGSQGP